MNAYHWFTFIRYQMYPARVAAPLATLGPPSNVFFSTSAQVVHGNTQLLSDLTDNEFYPFAERIWLCIRLKNAGKYCDITLKTHGNVVECVQILRTDFVRRKASSAPSIPYLVKCQKQCVHPININSPLFSTIEHFGDIIEMNFAKRAWYDATQSPIGPVVETIIIQYVFA